MPIVSPAPRLLLALALTLTATADAEEPMDVDLADSLDFEAFHREKEGAIKLWEEKHPAAGEAGERTTERPAADAEPSRSGQRYEIRELYSIQGSERTDLTPTTVVQALYAQMRDRCPDGWRKLDERSEPEGEDTFYMYYAFECL